MDMASVGAALALVENRLTGLAQSTQAATQAAQSANSAAQSANSAAAAAQGWATLTEAQRHTQVALNLMISVTQAEIRELKAAVDLLKAQVASLSS